MKATHEPRRATAAVELAGILPLLVLFILGSWEVGRLVMVSQLLNNAVREGGRQASTGKLTTSQVKDIVAEYCTQNGLSSVASSDVTVTNLTSSARSDPTTANQMDEFQVSISIPFSSVRWIILQQVTSVTNLTASAQWYSMRDVPLAVNSTIPLN